MQTFLPTGQRRNPNGAHNDKRMPNRMLTVVGFEAEAHDSRSVRVIAEDRRFRPPRTFRIKVAKVFEDGKPRSYGFNKVTHD